MGRKRRRKPVARNKVRQSGAPEVAGARAPEVSEPERQPRLWIALGSIGLLISGALIGAVVGAQIARQDFARDLLRLEEQIGKLQRTAPREVPQSQAFQARSASQHALNAFASDPVEEPPAEPHATPPPRPETVPLEPNAGPSQAGQIARAPALDALARSSEQGPGFTPEGQATSARVVFPLPQDGPAGEPTAIETRSSELPAWRKHAVAVEPGGDRPKIAIVIDDLGLNLPNTRRIIDLPAPLSLAFMTYGYDLEALTGQARKAGHELLVHFPMEPLGSDLDPGPKVLKTGLSESELLARLRWGLGRFEGYVGINNHMGSRFTSSRPDLAVVLRELKARGLMFLDSQTVAGSFGGRLSRELDLPYAQRDVFIDNVHEAEAIGVQLEKLERLARRRGFTVGIGHPHTATIRALAKWIPEAKARGFIFVPISDIANEPKTQG